MTAWQVFFGVITMIIAAYGAILSTYSVWLKDRLKIHVEMGWANPIFGNQIYSDHVMLKAKNHSIGRSVVLESFGFYVEGIRESLVFPDLNSYILNGRLPAEIKPGHNCQALIPDHVLFTNFISHNILKDIVLIGFFRDQLGKEYKSKPFKYPLIRKESS